MRRSRAVTTLLLAGSALALSACDGEPPQQDVKIYSSLEACTAEMPADTCEAAFKEAEKEHAVTAPRFASLDQCEGEAGPGACQTVRQQNADGSFTDMFMPFMVGYMVANALDNIGGSRHYYSRPLYADRRGFLYSGGNEITRMGNCNPRAADCRTGGGGASYAGRTAYNWSTTARVNSDSVSRSPAATSSSPSKSRASAGFGRTGGRAGLSASS